MKVLALDQARNCGYSIFDVDSHSLLSFGYYSYPSTKYTFPQAVLNIESAVAELVESEHINIVCLEGIQLRKNPKSYAALAQLQGVLINWCEKHSVPYCIVQPASWQSYCGAKGRSSKDAGKKIDLVTSENADVKLSGKKATKILSITYVKDKYGVDTYNDNIADAICIGTYIVNNIGKHFDFKDGEKI